MFFLDIPDRYLKYLQVVLITDRICLKVLPCVRAALSVTMYGFKKKHKMIKSSYFALFGDNCTSTKPRKKIDHILLKKKRFGGF